MSRTTINHPLLPQAQTLQFGASSSTPTGQLSGISPARPPASGHLAQSQFEPFTNPSKGLNTLVHLNSVDQPSEKGQGTEPLRLQDLEIRRIVDQVVPSDWGNKLCIRLTGSFSEAAKYRELQQAIAEKIPNEQYRPVIHVTLTHAEGDHHTFNIHRIGIIGGTGPCSDAEIVTCLADKALKELNDQPTSKGAYQIDLFSAPPPRLSGQTNLENRVEHGYKATQYGLALRRFMIKSPAKEFFLAGNTGHVNHLIGDMLMVGKAGQDKTIPHLVRTICRALSADMKKGERPLILSTRQAWKKKLYPNCFKRHGVEPIVPGKAQIQMIQAAIDAVKSKAPDSEIMKLRQQVMRILADMIQMAYKNGQAVSHIVLACTELPMLFKSAAGELIKDIQALLPAATPAKTIRIADTEQLFIEEMKRALLKPALQSQNKGMTFMSDHKLNARQIINKIGHHSSTALSGLLRELRDVKLK